MCGGPGGFAVMRHGTCDDCQDSGPVTPVRVDYQTDPTTWAELCGPCLRASQTDMEVLSVTVLPDERCADCSETVAGIDVQWGMATPYCGRCWELANVE